MSEIDDEMIYYNYCAYDLASENYEIHSRLTLIILEQLRHHNNYTVCLVNNKTVNIYYRQWWKYTRKNRKLMYRASEVGNF